MRKNPSKKEIYNFFKLINYWECFKCELDYNWSFNCSSCHLITWLSPFFNSFLFISCLLRILLPTNPTSHQSNCEQHHHESNSHGHSWSHRSFQHTVIIAAIPRLKVSVITFFQTVNTAIATERKNNFLIIWMLKIIFLAGVGFRWLGPICEVIFSNAISPIRLIFFSFFFFRLYIYFGISSWLFILCLGFILRFGFLNWFFRSFRLFICFNWSLFFV